VREGRHRDPGIVGQERHHAVDVAGLDRSGEAADDVALEFGVRHRRPLASAGGQAVFERCASPAQQVVHRRFAGLQQLGGLGRPVAQDIAEHEHRALLRGQMLKADDERQLDRFPGLVARSRTRSVVSDSLEENIGVRLDPQRFAPIGWLGHPGQRLVLRAPLAGAQGIQRAVSRDPV
jgi:hypothetical protein